jgi:hypothetical protein
MKKQFAALITVFALFLTMGTFVSAGSATDEMKAAIEKGLKSQHKDFNDGSLELSEVESFSNSDSELDATEVVVAIASYETVRDNIFYFDHTSYVFFNPDTNEMLSEASVAKANPKIQEYKKNHEAVIGTHMDFIVVTALLFSLLLIPLFILSVWEKRQYLTTKFKLENNLYNQTKFYR